MLNLYKTDLKRIVKDKLFLVACILAVVFALLNPLMTKFIVDALMEGDDTLMEMLGNNAKSMFFSSFAPGNNLGLIAPILLIIALCKDFSFGTVRNKIISGHSRASIFVSYFLSLATALCVLIFLHAGLTLGVSLLFFEYQETPFVLKDLGYLLISLGLELLVYLFIAALSTFLCVFMKNAGLAVVINVAVSFLFSIIGSIVATAAMFADPADKALTELLEALNNANIFMGTYIGMTPSYEWKGLLPVLLFTVGGIALFIALGTWTFRKKDLK